MDIKKIIAAGKAVAALDPRVAGVVAAVEAVIAIVDDARETVTIPDDQLAELSETREALEARVNAKADATADRLAG